MPAMSKPIVGQLAQEMSKQPFTVIKDTSPEGNSRHVTVVFLQLYT